MPWQELSSMDSRTHFMADWHTGYWMMTELCAEYQVSRKTGYKWVARHETEGRQGLHDRSRRPHHCPGATDPAIVDALVQLRKRYPRWGATKLLAVAARRGVARAADLPARSTLCELLRSRGLVRPRRRTARLPLLGTPPFAPITAPNDVWTVDFKGEFRLGNREFCFPLTLRDAYSRYVLRCEGLPDISYATTRRPLERAFARYGLPNRIRSDNGSPFASIGLAGLSRLSVWWMRLGITLERIALGHPEQNGSHEQFHSVLKAHTTRPPAIDHASQQRCFARFCAEYNAVRPHEALGNATPTDWYRPSRRPLPARLPPVEYDGHLDIRRVSKSGCVSWRNRIVFVTTALAGEDIGLEEVDTGVWTVWFAGTALARYHEGTSTMRPVMTTGGGRSAASPPRA
jgi:transposase InsO family protein